MKLIRFNLVCKAVLRSLVRVALARPHRGRHIPFRRHRQRQHSHDVACIWRPIGPKLAWSATARCATVILNQCASLASLFIPPCSCSLLYNVQDKKILSGGIFLCSHSKDSSGGETCASSIFVISCCFR
jgi:hypothetical protein